MSVCFSLLIRRFGDTFIIDISLATDIITPMAIHPIIFDGGYAKDERGSVRFVNTFHFKDVKRFYQVENEPRQSVRAFHGHMKEAKYVYVTKGRVLLCAVHLSDPSRPSKKVKVWKYVLSSASPKVLYIPPAYANGFKSLTPDASVIFFSTATVEESKLDDYRFDKNYWGNIWKTLK